MVYECEQFFDSDGIRILEDPGRFSPVAPVLQPNFSDPAGDWMSLFKAGVLEPVEDDQWKASLGPYGESEGANQLHNQSRFALKLASLLQQKHTGPYKFRVLTYNRPICECA